MLQIAYYKMARMYIVGYSWPNFFGTKCVRVRYYIHSIKKEVIGLSHLVQVMLPVVFQ
jgi:hypothetical protein